MDKTSKRDIYDLIAELAKSTNMDIDGTEFASEPVDVKRRSIALDEEKVVSKNGQDLIHLEPAPKEQASNTDSNLIHEIQLAKLASMEELNRMKAAALEELKQAKAALVSDLHHTEATSEVGELAQTANMNGINHSYESIQVNAVSKKEHPQKSIVNEAASKQAIEKNTDINDFETISIEELNRITSEAVKKEIEPVDETAKDISVRDELMHEQLKLMSEKIDQLNPSHLKTDIVNELKLSDERIVEQVNKSQENLLNELSHKINNQKSVSGDSTMKWLGMLNLMLLILVLAYLLFQKNSVAGSFQKLPQSASPDSPKDTVFNHENLPNNTPVAELTFSDRQVLNDNAITKEVPSASEVAQHQLNQHQASTIHLQTTTSKSKVVTEKSYNQRPLLNQTSNVTTELSAPSVQKTNVDVSNVGQSASVQKQHDAIIKTPSQVSNKPSSNQDVYFGED